MGFSQSLKHIFKSSWLAFVFFTVAFSYSEYASNHEMVNIKYIGIVLLLYNMLKKQVKLAVLPKQWFNRCVCLCLFFGIACIPQNASIFELVQTLAYMVFIGSLVQYANVIINKESDLFMIALGIFIAVLLAIKLEPTSMMLQGMGRQRVYGGFMHPNAFGNACMSICFCLFICLFNKKKKILYYIIILSMIAFSFDWIIKSDSNNALYTTLLFFAMIVYFKLTKHYNISKGFIIILFIACIVFGGYYMYNNMSEGLFESLMTRLNSINYINTDNIWELLFGNGLVGVASNSKWGSEFSITQMIIKIGIVGSLVLIYLFYYLCRKGFSNKNTDVDIYICLFVAFMVGSIAEAYIVNITNTFATLMWLLIAAFSNGVRISDSAIFVKRRSNII